MNVVDVISLLRGDVEDIAGAYCHRLPRLADYRSHSYLCDYTLYLLTAPVPRFGFDLPNAPATLSKPPINPLVT